MEEKRRLRERILAAIREGDGAEEIADEIMEAVAEDFRSLSEINRAMEAVKAGYGVQIAYYDPDEEDTPDGLPDPMTMKARWE